MEWSGGEPQAPEVLADLRRASYALQDEWMEGDDPQTWKRVKWDADTIAELCVPEAPSASSILLCGVIMSR